MKTKHRQTNIFFKTLDSFLKEHRSLGRGELELLKRARVEGGLRRGPPRVKPDVREIEAICGGTVLDAEVTYGHAAEPQDETLKMKFLTLKACCETQFDKDKHTLT